MVDQVPLLPYNLYMSEPPHLPVRSADDDGGPDFVARAEVRQQNARGVVLRGVTRSGENVTITVIMVAEGIARILLEDEYPDAGRVRLARSIQDDSSVIVEQGIERISLRTSSLRVDIDLDPFHIDFYGYDGRPILSQNYSEVTNVRMKLTVLPFGLSKVDGQRIAFHDSFTAEPDEHFFGLGEKFTDFDKRGQRLTMWNYDCGGVFSERSYKNVPFFVSTRGYGIFVDSPCPVDFDMVASNTAAFSIISPDSALDYYVIAGPDPKTIITRYASLVSFPILPPKWSLGTWVSTGFLSSGAADILRCAQMIRQYEIPCDVLHIDCYWQRFGRWSELIWDGALFPDPAWLIAELKAMGFKVCLWINPYIGIESERFARGSEKGYFLKDARGQTYVVDMWGGFHPPVGVLDVTHPQAVAWFKDLLREHLRLGIDIFKTDFGEGIPADAIGYNGMSGKHLHNLYALLYNDLVAEVIAEETGHSGLVWARSTYAGGQRHAAQWGGDANCTFPALAATLRGGLSLGMCGHAFWSHDIGGFTGHPTQELYIRWTQFGFFSALTRAHGNTSRLPWEFGDEALAIFRDNARLRYQLMPYIYTYACIAAETSLPIMRPMALEFPQDPNTCTMDLQYMFGEHLLVAPIYNSSGERPVYLPEGRWIDFWTHEVLTGPRTVRVQAPLTTLPLYVRANTLLPCTRPEQFISDQPFKHVIFDAYLLERGQFTLHDSDGTTTVSAAFAGPDRLYIEVEGAKQRLTLRLIPLNGAPQVAKVYVNGSEIPEMTRQDSTAIGNAWVVQEDGTTMIEIQ
jgi:alpha-D-xyloside xylohydrolase